MKRELNIISELWWQQNTAEGVSELTKELQEYENSCLAESEKELLMMLDLSSKPTYHCMECKTEVSPIFPSPIAYCPLCNEDVVWTKNLHIEDNITFEDLIKVTFNKAHVIINKMSLKKRIKMLEELDKHLLHCYEVTKQYNDQGFGKSISPEVFYKIMGKIKHLEILQNWLYFID